MTVLKFLSVVLAFLLGMYLMDVPTVVSAADGIAKGLGLAIIIMAGRSIES